MGAALGVTKDRIDLAGLDGRTVRIRLAERTLFILGGRRLAGARVVRPGNRVRIASVDTAAGPVAVLVELLAAAGTYAGPHAPAFRPAPAAGKTSR